MRVCVSVNLCDAYPAFKHTQCDRFAIVSIYIFGIKLQNVQLKRLQLPPIKLHQFGMKLLFLRAQTHTLAHVSHKLMELWVDHFVCAYFNFSTIHMEIPQIYLYFFRISPVRSLLSARAFVRLFKRIIEINIFVVLSSNCT